MGDLRRTVLPLMLLGDGQVGKTSLILRYTENTFDESGTSTCGIDFKCKFVSCDDKKIRLDIWDTAGQERFKSMSVQVIKNSDAVILVYAIDDLTSFKDLDQWLSKLNETTDITKKPIIIIGNKADVENGKREVTYEEGRNYAENKGYKFYETSAKTGQNINEAFNDIFEQLYKTFENEITGEQPVNAGIQINKKNKGRKKCC